MKRIICALLCLVLASGVFACALADDQEQPIHYEYNTKLFNALLVLTDASAEADIYRQTTNTLHNVSNLISMSSTCPAYDEERYNALMKASARLFSNALGNDIHFSSFYNSDFPSKHFTEWKLINDFLKKFLKPKDMNEAQNSELSLPFI